jgi:CDP-4-dehydro-6-deoxyglucose reductase
MVFQVTLKPSGHTFKVPAGKSILHSGLDAGLSMPYSCKTGVCQTCKGRILEGAVDYGAVHPHYFTEKDRVEGYALLCQARPLSDVTIEVRELDGLEGIVVKTVPCRVMTIEKPVPDVAVLKVRLPLNENMRFVAGQYIEFLLKEGKRRAYSIASKPKPEGTIDLELHVRHTPGGVFTDHVFSKMKERDLLRFEGPFGTFYLREESAKPIVLVASGTGFAPIKSICEYAFERGINTARPMTLFWGCRSRSDLYMFDLPARWAAEQQNFRFVPVLSDPAPDDAWTGRTGFVHRAVMQDFPDLSGYQVYACGAPVMVDAAKRDFIAGCGLPADQFFADSFLTEADRAQPAAAA